MFYAFMRRNVLSLVQCHEIAMKNWPSSRALNSITVNRSWGRETCPNISLAYFEKVSREFHLFTRQVATLFHTRTIAKHAL